MTEALEALSNIDNVTVTHEKNITSYDDSVGVLEVRYNITFDGDCVRGNIPTGDFTASCYPSATTVLSDVECRYEQANSFVYFCDPLCALSFSKTLKRHFSCENESSRLTFAV